MDRIAQRYGVLPFDPDLKQSMDNPYRRELLLWSLGNEKTEAVQIANAQMEQNFNLTDIIITTLLNRLGDVYNAIYCMATHKKKGPIKNIKSMFKKDNIKSIPDFQGGTQKVRMLN